MSEESKKELEDDVSNVKSDTDTTAHRHHHSHHHHGHHRSGGSSKKKGIKHFFKKNAKVLKILALVLCAIILVGVIFLFENGLFNNKNTAVDPDKNGDDTELGYEEQLIYIGTPVIQGDVDLLGEAARDYVESDASIPMSQILLQYTELDDRNDAGRSLTLDFDVQHLPRGVAVQSAELELSESNNFEKSVFYDLGNDYSVDIINLKSGTQYYYRSVFTLTNNEIVTGGGSFTTKTGPRIMNIDGIYNVRDIGGWKTTDKKVIRQGLLYRGTELDGAVEEKYLITSKGTNELLLNLGVKYDMDLRASTDNTSGRYILGTNVVHKYYNAVMYSEIFNEVGKERMRAIFEDIAEPANYPMYMHCTYGCDRTGTVCYILEALLGVSENDLIRDYELSGLFSSSITRDNIKLVREGLMSYDGETVKEQAENYLISIGITSAQIASIRNIFLQ